MADLIEPSTDGDVAPEPLVTELWRQFAYGKLETVGQTHAALHAAEPSVQGDVFCRLMRTALREGYPEEDVIAFWTLAEYPIESMT